MLQTELRPVAGALPSLLGLPFTRPFQTSFPVIGEEPMDLLAGVPIRECGLRHGEQFADDFHDHDV